MEMPRSRARIFWLSLIMSLIFLGFLSFIGVTAWIASVSSRNPNPAAGQIVRVSMSHGGAIYLSPAQASLRLLGSVASVAFSVAMMLIYTLVDSSDPIAMKMPPRPPDVDPLADRTK
jgi:hypothetical protein